MDFVWSVVGFILAVSLLVTVHEFGHFWVARKLGFKVLRFSVGFGKPLFKIVGSAPDHTEYVVAAIPLGGYVRMLDERDGSVVSAADLPRAFGRRPPWQRILVLLAGPAINILFAVLVLWVMFWIHGIDSIRPVVEQVSVDSPAAAAGLRPKDEILAIDGTHTQDRGDVLLGLIDAMSDDGEAVLTVRRANGSERAASLLAVPDPALRHQLTEPDLMLLGLGFRFWLPRLPATIGNVIPEGPAARAGLQTGDEIIAIDNSPIRSFDELTDYVNARPAQKLNFTLRRNGNTIQKPVVTSRDELVGRIIGRIRVEPVLSKTEAAVSIPAELKTRVELGPIDALGLSVAKSWQMTAAQAKFFVRMLTGQISSKNISGFISIAKFSGDAVQSGPGDFLMFLVLLSLSLGFLNLLPIPILDGGQIVFQVAEWAKGGPLSDRTYMVGQQAGLLLLVLLMGVALFNDLSGIFGTRS